MHYNLMQILSEINDFRMPSKINYKLTDIILLVFIIGLKNGSISNLLILIPPFLYLIWLTLGCTINQRPIIKTIL